MRRRILARSHDDSLDSAGRIHLPKHLIDHAGLEGSCVVVGLVDHLELWSAEAWNAHNEEIDAGAEEMSEEVARRMTGADAKGGGADGGGATLTYMPTEHVPVLASELIALTGPRPGEVAVDCTFGAGGHARLVAERLAPGGELICIDRDPTAEERFAEFAHDAPCETRFVRADSPTPSRGSRRRGSARTSSTWTPGSRRPVAWERGFSYSYDAPLDMRMDPDQELSALEVVSTNGPNAASPTRSATTARSATRAASRARSSAAGCCGPPRQLVEAIRAALPPEARLRARPSRQAHVPGIRIAVNGELEALDIALPAAWELLRPGGRLAAISFHSLEDRRVKRFLAARATGCTCPPRSRSASAAGPPRRSC